VKKIIFTKVNEQVSDTFAPKQMSKNLPEWYKSLYSYFGTDNKKVLDKNFDIPSSIKRCIPVLDVLSAGYLIPTYCDIWVRKSEDGKIYYKSAIPNAIEFHPTEQAPNHPYMNQHPYPKFINSWSIETPKGYSCLFLPPVHGGNTFFQILEGFVDTDKYNNPVNFPFVLKDVNFEGLIPAGTPLAQVIPIKRDNWEMSFGNQNNIKNIVDHSNLIRSGFFDNYKKRFWSKKVYN
jgi:hypothetical protein